MAIANDRRAALSAIARDPGEFASIITDLHLLDVDRFEVLQGAVT